MQSGDKIVIIPDVTGEYPDYLRDESRLAGQASSISFPVSEQELSQTLALMSSKHTPVTIQGARTGIAGGAVPKSGHVLNLSRMNRIIGMRYDPKLNHFNVIVQPGVILTQLRQALAAKEFDTAGWSGDSLAALDLFRNSGAWFFPPDPTETSAALGGMVAANASGACSFAYGPTRKYVMRLRTVLADGSALELQRGTSRALKRAFEVTTEAGKTIKGDLPTYTMPEVKNAAGYFAADNMDIIDLFVGSEGTLAVFSEIELMLVPVPAALFAVLAFFPSEEKSVRFACAVRSNLIRPVAVEFFDEKSLEFLRQQRTQSSAFQHLPDPPAGRNSAIYVEYHGNSDEALESAVNQMSIQMQECGGSDSNTWTATDKVELERLKSFRHAIPEAVNLFIGQQRQTEPGITKLGTDMAVPDPELATILSTYHSDIEATGLDYVMFGHIGNNHIHVNLLPRNQAQYELGKKLYLGWARKVIAAGGTISAEHGIGKLKVALLAEMYGETGISQMRTVKKAFDPDGLLNRGNLFD